MTFDPNKKFEVVDEFDPSQPFETLDEAKSDSITDETPKTSSSEAALLGAGEGITFGGDQIIAGISGALGDYFGRDEETENKKNELFKKLGIVDPDQAKSLKDIYYEARDLHRKKKELASEEHPLAYYGGVAGSSLLMPGVASGVLKTAEGALAKKGAEQLATKAIEKGAEEAALASGEAALSKTLENVAPSTGSKMFNGFTTGAKVGALTGALGGEAKLGEGEIGKLLGETATSGAFGGAIGGILPGIIPAGKKLLKYAETIPGIDTGVSAFKYGKAGKELTEEVVNKDIQDTAENIFETLQKHVKNYGETKGDLQKLSEELSIKVHAGDDIKDTLDSMTKELSIGMDSESKKKFITDIKETFNNEKALTKLENLQNKKVAKSKVNELLGPNDNIKGIGRFSREESPISTEPISGIEESTGNPYIAQVENNKRISTIGDMLSTDKIPDIDNMSLKEAEAFLSNLNNYTGIRGRTPLIDNSTVIIRARALAGKVRDHINKAISDAGGSAIERRDMSRTLAGMDKLGIQKHKINKYVTEGLDAEGNKLTNVEFNDNVDNLKKEILNQGESSKIDRDRAFQYFKEGKVDKATELESKVNELNNLKNIVSKQKGGGGGGGTLNTGFLGTARSLIGRGSNIAGLQVNDAGKIVSNIQKSAANKLTKMSTGLNNLIKLGGPDIENIANQLQSKGEVASQYIGPLMKAAASNRQSRAAIMVGLYQQPAFRTIVKSINSNMFGIEDNEE